MQRSCAGRDGRCPGAGPGGLFAFTVETHDEPGVRLQGTLRYAHGPAHVRDGHRRRPGWNCGNHAASTRNEKGAPVPGLLVVASTLGHIDTNSL